MSSRYGYPPPPSSSSFSSPSVISHYHPTTTTHPHHPHSPHYFDSHRHGKKWRRRRNRWLRRQHNHLFHYPRYHPTYIGADMGELLGPSTEPSDESAVIMDKYSIIYEQYIEHNSPAHAAYNTLIDVRQALDELDLDKTQIPHSSQRIILGSYIHKTPVRLELKSGKQKVVLTGTANPLDHENIVYVDFPLSESNFMSIVEDGPLRFVLYNDLGERFTHDDIISVGPVFDSPELTSGAASSVHSSTVTLPIPLYDESMQTTYAKHSLPTPRGIVNLQLNGPSKPMKVRNVRILLDLRPTAQPNAQVSGVPTMASTDIEPVIQATPVYTHETPVGGYTDRLYEHLVAALAPQISHENWTLSSTGSKPRNPELAERLAHWGLVTQTAVAYTVVSLLHKSTKAKELNSDKFLMKMLSSDEVGKQVVKTITKLAEASRKQQSEALSEKKGGAEFQYNEGGVQLFPSLYQLLHHTSGLPSIGNSPCGDDMKIYSDVIEDLQGVLKGTTGTSTPPSSSSSSSPSSSSSDSEDSDEEDEQKEKGSSSSSGNIEKDSYSSGEKEFLEALKGLTQIETLPGASYGSDTNLTESILIAMFLRRYLNTRGKFPEEIINDTLAPLKVKLSWGRHPQKQGSEYVHVDSPPSPANLIQCGGSSVASLQSYAEGLLSELHPSKAQESPFAHMLSVSTAEAGGNRNLSRSFSWRKRRVGKNMTLCYAGDQFSGLNTVFIGIVPELNWCFSFVEQAYDKQVPLLKTVDELAKMFAGVIATEPSLPKIPKQVHAQAVHYLENRRYAMTLDKIKVQPDIDATALVPAEREYTHVFVDRYAGEMPKLSLSFDTAHKNRIILKRTVGTVVTNLVGVYDPKRAGFYLVTDPSNSSSPIGERITIGRNPSSITIDNMIFIDNKSAERILSTYSETIKGIQTKNQTEVFDSPITEVAKAIQPSSIPRAAFFEASQPSIGAHGLATGLLLGGVGALGLASLVRPWGGYGGWGYGDYPGWGYGGYGYPYYYGYGWDRPYFHRHRRNWGRHHRGRRHRGRR